MHLLLVDEVDCYCGEGQLDPTSEVHIGLCNARCLTVSDELPFEACGGVDDLMLGDSTIYYMSVYELPVPANGPKPPNSVQGPNGQSDLLGCYTLWDNKGGGTRALTSGVLQLDGMTNEVEIY